MNEKVREVEKKLLNKKEYDFAIGDTIDVHFRIKEGDKTRIQIFSGIVINMKGTGMKEMLPCEGSLTVKALNVSFRLTLLLSRR